ncbi:hypothetical protein [Arsenicibacter rosenii]|uniref:Cytochrome B n=1 Tax=Arsenicibacter rosenii TaxID=1750698 RepID=A0A1S2VR43_9BACT|nr:hypothetical protein [Arsenicibacter rosenii]OIN61257.1 hypothetical protein BLX24_01070 [Arsenicibacter rosenii]
MYSTALVIHSFFRWLVLLSLLYAIFRAFRGIQAGARFSKNDNSIRHWTATISHIQLLLGFAVYLKSPVVNAFWDNPKAASGQMGLLFFSVIHFALMLLAIMVITIGSAKAKRAETDREKFRTMGVWFAAGLFIIFLAIPWPFSPLANRPLLRGF